MERLSDRDARALAGLDGQRDVMLGRVLDWAAVNSGSRNLAGLADMAARLEAAAAPLGADVRRVPAAGHGDSLHLVKRADAPVQLLLTGHMDTVFGPEDGFLGCRWLAGGVLNGPGVADMKGGLAVMLAALEAFEASAFAERLGWQVVINADEEISSPGSAALLREAAGRAHLGLTFEPALADGTLAGARRGSGNFAAHVAGVAAHAGRNPEDGRNAVLAAAALAVRLAGLAGDDLSVNVARLEGGGALNVVPERAVLRWNMRAADADSLTRALAGVEAAVAEIEAGHGVAVRLEGGFTRPPKPLDAHQLRLFRLVRDCGAALGLEIGWRPSGGVCDGNNLAAAGLSVVDTMGVRGGAIHSADEFLLVDSLEERARLALLVMCRVAQHGWGR